MPVYKSTVPDAVDALVTVLRSTFPAGDVLVCDGPTLNAATIHRVVSVGWNPAGETTPGTAQPAVSADTTPEGLGSLRERYRISCAVLVLEGSGQITTARQEAYDLHRQVGQALAVNPKLNGSVLQTTMASGSTLLQDQDDLGARAVVAFDILCEAYAQQ